MAHILKSITVHIQTVLDMGTFFTMIYAAHLCTYLAPTGRLRRWGMTKWWLPFRLGPAWPKEAIAREWVYRERGIGLRRAHRGIA